MRKLYAILVTLLFVTSVFGVASITATGPSYSCNDYYRISRTSAHVGDILTMSSLLDATGDVMLDNKTLGSISRDIESKGGLPYQLGPLELINVEYFDEDWNLIHAGFAPESYWNEHPEDYLKIKWITWTFRGAKPGAITLINEECNEEVSITITPKSTPMFSFMKILGFGKKK
ncbi:MAG: hypothetical protein KO464_03460 [Candidatus Methanofastidiosum sp.]|nr:hypothetical protein [Methanofastidiosum sp.]